jgi:hypothetical protein
VINDRNSNILIEAWDISRFCLMDPKLSERTGVPNTFRKTEQRRDSEPN